MSERKTDNFVMRIWLETIQNSVGSNGLQSLLDHAHLKKYSDFPPDNDRLEIPLEDLQNLVHTFFQLFGKKNIHTHQVQIGHESTRIAMEKRPGMVKTLRISACLVPKPDQIRLALEKFVEEDNKRFPSQPDAHTELQEEEDCFLIIERHSYMSEGITSGEPVCGIYVGILQTLVEWVTGHVHKVEEVECRAMGGPADVFKISKAYKED